MKLAMPHDKLSRILPSVTSLRRSYVGRSYLMQLPGQIEACGKKDRFFIQIRTRFQLPNQYSI